MCQPSCLQLRYQRFQRERLLSFLPFLLGFFVLFIYTVAADAPVSSEMSSISTGDEAKGETDAAEEITLPVKDTEQLEEKTLSASLKDQFQAADDTSRDETVSEATVEPSNVYVRNSMLEGRQKDDASVVEREKKEGEKQKTVSDLPFSGLRSDSAMSFTGGGEEAKDVTPVAKMNEENNADDWKGMDYKDDFYLEEKDDVDKPAVGRISPRGVSQFASPRLSLAELSELYYRAMRSIYEEGNLTAAIKFLEEGASRGHGRMHWLLGVLYANGIGVAQSDAKAILHYTFAAMDSVPEAHLALGRRYMDGIGVAKNCESAVGHYREVADAVAMTYEGMPNPTHRFYGAHGLDGSHQNENDNDAKMSLLIYNADLGVSEAMISLGYVYFIGKYGVRRDWHRARNYFLEALNKGEVTAYGALGQLYATGDPTAQPVIERDLETAATYFAKGAEKQDPTSLNGMGYLYAIGFLEKDKLATSLGGPDFVKAAKFFKESANRGNTEGMYNLGVLLLYGRGLPPNPAAAIKQFEAAASRGSVLSFWQLARHEHMKGNCARALFLYDRVTSFGSMFDRHSDTHFFTSLDGRSSSSSTPSKPPIVPRGNNALAEVLEALALAETGHTASRCHAAKVVDSLPIFEETEEELDDGVFVKNDRPPQRAMHLGGGAVWLHWLYDGKLSNREGTSSSRVLSQARLLSQREALNMLRLRLYSLCSLTGSPEANLWLGDFYYYGESRLFGVSMSQAFLHYEAAARKQNPKALFNLGFMYQLGLGVTGGGHAVGVRDAIYRIITNTPLNKEEEEDDEGIRGEGNLTAARSSARKGVVDTLAAEEMRLYLAKRYYDRVMEVGSDGTVYVVKLALMSLNFQWWWWHFSRQRYGFSEALRLPLPMARVRETTSIVATASPQEEEQRQEEQKHEEFIPPMGFVERVEGGWRWDDYTLLGSATLLFLLLLVRHHGA